jgi:general secretion pathway protein M
MNGAGPNDRRASGALVVLLLLVVLIGAAGLTGFDMLRSKWNELDAQQAQLDMLKGRRPASTPSVAQAPITIKPFLAEESFALAANALQKRVVAAIEQTDGKLITVGVDPPVTGDEELARRVSVQVTAELTNDALQKVLYQLENGVPFAFVDTFTASRLEREGAAKNEAQVAPRLSVSMSVIGYRSKGGQ